MANPLLIHPERDSLVAYGLGKLEPDEASQIELHLDQCETCCETLLDLKDDTFVSLVRKSPEALAGQQAEVQATIDSQSGLLGESATLAELPPELLRHPRYEIVEMIGRGGMGDVYKAQHKVMNRTVALKVIRPELVKNAAAVDRFQREVQAAARLHHGNIVTAYDAEQAGRLHFLVMEFVAGVDLSQVVQERGLLPVSEACDYVRQAAAGLDHAHQLGMVHRDIKPHNLMLTGDGEIKILDFGLANFANEVVAQEASDDVSTGADSTHRALQQLTQLGTMMGTPDYIAPEQAADARTADIRADIYSLGCTLSFLLTAKPLFETASVTDKLKAHAEQPPPKLTNARGDIPPELQQVVDRMLAKDPGKRFQTPAEVAAALAPFARPASTPPRKRTLRNVLAATAAIVLAGVIYITTDKGRIEIRTDVDDVDVVVSRGGEEVKTIDLATESQVTWMPSGDYTISLKQDRNDIQITPSGFTLSRWGKQVVSLSRMPAAAASTEHEQIQGTWIAESGQRNGEPTPLDKIDMQRMVFDGDKLHVEGPGGKKGEGHFLLIEANDPKQIGVFVTGDSRGLRGIYKLEGDRLTICLDKDQSADIPKTFAAPARTTLDLIVLRRAAVVGPDADVAQGPPNSVFDQLLLQGLWIAVSGHAGKQAIPAEQLPKFSITIDQDQITIAPPGTQSQVQRGTFKNNARSTPRQIDIVVADKKEPMAGIYEVDQQWLKLALVEGDAARPTDFSPSDRPDHVTGVFERAPITGWSEYVEFKPAGLNGGFEVTQFGLPVNWSFYTPRTVPKADFDIAMDKTEFKEGEQSLKFVVRNCEPTGGRLSPGFFKDFWTANSTPFETRPGETYKISFWAKNAGSELVFKARGVSPSKGDPGVVIRSKETFNQWRRFECTYTIPPGPKMHLRLELNVVQPGTFWMDDLQIVKVNDKAAATPDDVRLQGKWVPVSCLYRGKPFTEEQLLRMSITLDGARATMTDPDSGQAMSGTFTIDATRSPKHIDFIAPDGKERMPGIFEFDGERLKMAWCDGDYARPTNFEPAQTADHMTANFQRVPGSAQAAVPQNNEPAAAPVLDETQKEVVKAAEAYLAEMDAGRFGQLRDISAAFVKRRETREQFSQKHQKLRDIFGKATRRTLEWVRPLDEPPGMPMGRYANVQYRSSFERVQDSWEVLSLLLESDGKWRVVGYAHTLEPLPSSEPKEKPQATTESTPPRTAAPTPPPAVPGFHGERQ